jgi:hypothetical protein
VETAARLLAASELLSPSKDLNPADRAEFERILTAVRLDEATFATVWVEGQAMTQEQAVSEAYMRVLTQSIQSPSST